MVFAHLVLSQYLVPNKPKNPLLDIVLPHSLQYTPTPVLITLGNGGDGGGGIFVFGALDISFSMYIKNESPQ